MNDTSAFENLTREALAQIDLGTVMKGIAMVEVVLVLVACLCAFGWAISVLVQPWRRKHAVDHHSGRPRKAA